ncbi:MAG: c-type cytochrome [Bryobacteraceae bacterium]
MRAVIPLLLLTLLLAACRRDMQDQPKYKPLAESKFFVDHRSARPMVDDTVPRGYLRTDLVRYTGKMNGVDVNYFPFPIARADLERGRDRFNIYCSPCHSRLGDGNGLIVKRGYRNPPSYYSDRVMKAPVGHFFDVITNGFGAMPSYASRLIPDDRWRIIAYIRVLQFSQTATISDVPPEDRSELVAGGAVASANAGSPNPPPQSTTGPNEAPSPFSGVIPPAVPFNANAPSGAEVNRPYGESPASAAPGTLPVDSTVTTEGANPR